MRDSNMRSRSRMVSRIALVLFVGLGLTAANAQFKASIEGTVVDPKGAAVSGAKITILNPETGISRETVASEQGYYRVAELPPGQYTVTVEAASFKSSV